MNKGRSDNDAVECYLQALRIDKNHLPSIFNLACKYQ